MYLNYVELFCGVFTQGTLFVWEVKLQHQLVWFAFTLHFFFSNEPNLLSNIGRIDCSSVVAVMHHLITGKDEDNDVEE